MEKYIVATTKAPAAIGPYSQAVGFNNLLFLSGQVALDPDSGQLTGDTVEAQTRQTMHNIQAVLEAANLGLENVLKATIFLANMNDFALVNEIYAGYFPKDPPARSTVEVSRLPRNALVEIEIIAAFPTEG
jgi:2-iminobutanoate/2-iminopropanoate deaminase